MLTVLKDEHESTDAPRRAIGTDEKLRMREEMARAPKGSRVVVYTAVGRLTFTDPVFFPAKRMNEWSVTVDEVPKWWPEGRLTGHLVVEYDGLVHFIGTDENGVDCKRLVGDIYGYYITTS